MSDQASFIHSPPKKGGRGNRNDTTTQKQQKEKQNDLNSSFDSRLVSRDDEKPGSKSDTSFFHNENDDDYEDKKKKKPDTISEKSQDEEELTPDKNDQSNWDIDQNQTEVDKNKKKQEQKPVEVSRGTRGNRNSSSEKEKQPNTISPAVKNINPDHQLPSSQSSGPKKRGNRNTQDIPYQKGFGGNSGRPYRNDEDSEYNSNRNYNNQEQGGYRGGYRGGSRGGYRGGYRGNRGSDSNSQRDDQNNKNDNNSKFGTDSDGGNQSTYKNPNFSKKPRYYEDKNFSYSSRENNRNSYGNDYSGGGYNRGRQPQVVEKVVEKIVEKIVQKQVIKFVEPPRPTGIRVQPSVSMFIKGCKLTLACRKLQEFQADLLIIPYKTAKLQLFPGYLVNACEINYKAKLKQKGPKMLEQGKLVYMQKCIGHSKFKAFAFTNVADVQNNIKQGIKEVLQNVKMISGGNEKIGHKFQSIVFPISTGLGHSKTVLSTFVKQIENYHTIVKDVYVLAEDYKAFCEAVIKFNEIFLELYEENQLI